MAASADVFSADFSRGWAQARAGCSRGNLQRMTDAVLKGFDAYHTEATKQDVVRHRAIQPVPANAQLAMYRAIYRRGYADASAQYQTPTQEIIDKVINEMLIQVAI